MVTTNTTQCTAEDLEIINLMRSSIGYPLLTMEQASQLPSDDETKKKRTEWMITFIKSYLAVRDQLYFKPSLD